MLKEGEERRWVWRRMREGSRTRREFLARCDHRLEEQKELSSSLSFAYSLAAAAVPALQSPRGVDPPALVRH